jgi:K+/H+ antiporter YhaU regulatory subunit KhtT
LSQQYPMSDLEYTRHALGRIAKRQIQVEWIERAVQQPDVVEDDEFDTELEHRLGKVPELANRVLRVIVTKTDPKRVITLHLDRRMKRKI